MESARNRYPFTSTTLQRIKKNIDFLGNYIRHVTPSPTSGEATGKDNQPRALVFIPSFPIVFRS